MHKHNVMMSWYSIIMPNVTVLVNHCYVIKVLQYQLFFSELWGQAEVYLLKSSHANQCYLYYTLDNLFPLEALGSTL